MPAPAVVTLDSALRLPQRWAWIVAASGFAAALAALSVPFPQSQTPEIAAILLVGVLALAAGHWWGMLVVAAADVVLLGTLWPTVLAQMPPDGLSGIGAWVALAGSTPGLLVFPRALPGIVDLILGRAPSPRLRVVALHTGRAVTALWLAVPALSLALG